MTRRTPRSAFTLIELLVAIALAIVILGLTIYIVNSAMFDSYKVVGSGDRLSQWLMIAKNRALRDKTPVGVRLYVTTVNGVKVVQEAAYIERPTPLSLAEQFPNARVLLYYPATASGSGQPALNADNRRIYLAGITNAQWTAITPAPIQPGDVVYFPDLRVSLRVRAVNSPPVVPPGPPTRPPFPGNAEVEIEVDTPGTSLPDLGAAHSLTSLTAPNDGTVAFPFATGGVLIFRQPNVLLGEPTLQISSSMAIDTTLSKNGSANLDTQTTTVGGVEWFDILFSPSGEVVGTTNGFIGLLLRDVNKTLNRTPGSIDLTNATPTLDDDYDKAGEMVIVAIYPKTGAIATHPVANDPTGANGGPFQFAKDAINSGL